jgi:hypothetical protein
MYINAQPPAILSLAAPAELSMHRVGESQTLKLAPYQIVQATVAEGGMERVVLKIKDHQLSADTKVPLRTGQKLNLQVMATSPQTHLRIMEEAELRHLFRLLHSFGRSIRIMPLLENMGPEAKAMVSNLMNVLGSDPNTVSGGDISRLWQDMGLNLEALLAQGRTSEAFSGFKALLFMQAGSGQVGGAATEEASAMLEHLNLFQLCRYRLAQDNTVFLPLPFEFVEQGYLLAQKHQPRQGEDQDADDPADSPDDSPAWKMNLNLKLSVLGSLEILLLFEDPGLRMRVLCETQKCAKTISQAMPQLADRLTTVSLLGYSVDTGARDPVMTLLERLVPEGDHFLEARA